MNLYETHPFLVIPIQIAFTLVLVAYLISFLGGWWSLSRAHLTSRPLPRGSFLGSGSFRYLAGYNNVLRLGSDAEGLYLRFWPRLAHPPLFIPWTQIELRKPFRFIIRQQTLVLGNEQRVPLTLREGDVQRLLFMAGKAAPQYDIEGIARFT